MKILAVIYRFLSPFFNPIWIINWIRWYIHFFKTLFEFKSKNKNFKIFNSDYFPQIFDKTDTTPMDYQYFHQQLWCFENIQKNKPERHVDIWSTYTMSWYISKITNAEFIDIRPIEVWLNNLKIKKGSIVNIPYENDSINSLSCLHVIEHIWLWRYWDPVDPSWDEKWCKELQRVLAKWWNLYLSTPIWKEKICFNAHRIFDPKTIVNYFDKLELIDFSIIDDSWNLLENADYKNIPDINYWLWMFLFKK